LLEGLVQLCNPVKQVQTAQRYKAAAVVFPTEVYPGQYALQKVHNTGNTDQVVAVHAGMSAEYIAQLMDALRANQTVMVEILPGSLDHELTLTSSRGY
jgi:hypothetical protein